MVLWRQRMIRLTLVFSDIMLSLVVWGGAFALQSVWGRGAPSDVMIGTVTPSVVLWVGLRALLGLYPGYGLNQAEELRRQTYATLTTLAITSTFAVALQVGDRMSRLMLGLSFLGLLLFAPLARQLVKWGMMKARLWGKPVVLLGSGEPGRHITTLLVKEWGLGYIPVAVFDIPSAATEGSHITPEEESLAQALDLSKKRGIDSIVFAMPHTRREDIPRLVDAVSMRFRHVMIIPNLGGITNSTVMARDLAGTLAVEIRHTLLDARVRKVKRALDLFGAVVGGLIISPILLALAVLVKLDSPGPALYGHQRLGAADRHFRCWKFRTMHTNAEELLDQYLQNNPQLQDEWARGFKLRSDPRVTRMGRFLRKTSLDELPQLWNVLCGEMSLVGPRPIVDAEVSKYGKVYALYRRIRPGMSGFWQVSGRNSTSYEERVALDAYYIQNWSIWLDFVILARTVSSVILGRGAH